MCGSGHPTQAYTSAVMCGCSAKGPVVAYPAAGRLPVADDTDSSGHSDSGNDQN